MMKDESNTESEIARRFESLYADLQTEIERRKPKCELSGRCCQFEEFGHRMYITSGELAVFRHKLNVLPNAPSTENWEGKGCPFQKGKLCGVHSIRPMGCRIFFCDSTSTDWQNQQYEQFHGKIKALHEELGLAYSYTEWREGLRQIGIHAT
jgi:Fe-S-cluster containining protein